MSMYQIPVVFPPSTIVDVSKVMYALPSYHIGTENDNSNIGSGSEEPQFLDPERNLELKQVALIKQLEELSTKLNEALAAAGKSKSVEKPQQQGKKQDKGDVKINIKENTPPTQEGGNKKKDKDAKKEARKENKAKAVAGVGNAAPSKSGKAGGSEKQWIVKEDKQTVETGQSLTACAPQSLSAFEAISAGNVEITVTQDDLPWVENLAKIGCTRGVAFEGKVKNNAKDAKTTVKVTVSNVVSLSSGEGKISGRVTVWKVLGSSLGLFSFASQQAIHAAHSHNWLSEVDAVLNNEQFKDQLVRSLSQFLSRFDSLGGQFNVSISDVVAYSILSTLSYLPNNVEMWAGRVKKNIV